MKDSGVVPFVLATGVRKGLEWNTSETGAEQARTKRAKAAMKRCNRRILSPVFLTAGILDTISMRSTKRPCRAH